MWETRSEILTEKVVMTNYDRYVFQGLVCLSHWELFSIFFILFFWLTLYLNSVKTQLQDVRSNFTDSYSQSKQIYSEYWTVCLLVCCAPFLSAQIGSNIFQIFYDTTCIRLWFVFHIEIIVEFIPLFLASTVLKTL